MLVYQRHMALQRFQEQEQQIHQRRILQQQQVGHVNGSAQMPVASMVGSMSYYPNNQIVNGQTQMMPPQDIYQHPSQSTVCNVQQPSLSYGTTAYTNSGYT